MASGSGFSYISDRIQSWKNPESDPSGKTFQTYESLLSIGSGGWFGLGFGESRQNTICLSRKTTSFSLLSARSLASLVQW